MGSRNEPPVPADGQSKSLLAQSLRAKAWRGQPWPPGVARQQAAAGIMAARVSLPATIAIFALAFLLPTWPWLSGAVTIPWDAKSQFFPQVQFLASALARGEWPWWSPNVFAGWPQISDPAARVVSAV